MSTMASVSWIRPEVKAATDDRADDDDDGIDGQAMTDADFWEAVPHEGDNPVGMTDCGLEDGLLHGGPTGPAVDGKKGIKRRPGGTLGITYKKAAKLK